MKRNENYVAPAISVRSTRIRCSILAGSNATNGATVRAIASGFDSDDDERFLLNANKRREILDF